MKLTLLLFLFVSQLFGIVDLNNATSSQLLELNGIGKAKAQKIVAYRKINGCFKSVDELARVDGISKKIVASNRLIVITGRCETAKKPIASRLSSLRSVLLDPVNITFVTFMFILTFLEIKTKKDLKSQIVSMGVLGTFVGIFIGLQAFNPDDITNSVNDILEGLKTAFFTSIVGMSLSTILSLREKFTDE